MTCEVGIQTGCSLKRGKQALICVWDQCNTSPLHLPEKDLSSPFCFLTYTFTCHFLNVSFPNIMAVWLHLHSSGTVVLQGKILASTFYSDSSGNTPPSWNSCTQLLPKDNSGKKKILQLLSEGLQEELPVLKDFQMFYSFEKHSPSFLRWPSLLV